MMTKLSPGTLMSIGRIHLALRAFYVIILESDVYDSALNINQLKFRFLDEVEFMQNDTMRADQFKRIRIFSLRTMACFSLIAKTT